MARRRQTRKSYWFLKTVILLCISFGIWYLSQHPDILRRKKDAPPPPEPEVVQTIPEPEVIRPGTKLQVSYTIRCPQFDNLSYGVPGAADTIVEREGYALGYIERHEQPAWVQYVMTAEEVSRRAAKRGDDFRPDPEIPTGSATPQDYIRSGYDRGHLAPAADMSFSAKTMSESFYMSNMSPQEPEFNRGIWKLLETWVRYTAVTEKDIYIVTGPILPKIKTPETITIGPSKVTVPEAYYKVVWDRTEPMKMIGFILPNKGSSEPLQSFVVSVDEVEQKTGLDFFSMLPKEQQEALESNITIDAWKWQ